MLSDAPGSPLSRGRAEKKKSGGMIERFPWRDVMAFGLGRLRLPSAAFWAMTPRELDAALRGRFGPLPAAPPCKQDLAALIARYPDR